MARQFILLFIVGMLLLAAGCQSNSVVENLPPPDFNGPMITEPVAVVAPSPMTLPPAIHRAGTGLPSEAGWIPNAPARPWKWIVIHHSATPSGSAAVFDKMHREKGWDELGYHFVIGNGTDSGDGQIEVGSRWPKQKWGAHAKTPDNRYNDYGIGICLVGNFDIEKPTPKQIQSLIKLTSWLMQNYHITPDNLIGHKDTKSTDCPGTNLYHDLAMIRSTAQRKVAEAGQPSDVPVRTAAGELLEDAPTTQPVP